MDSWLHGSWLRWAGVCVLVVAAGAAPSASHNIPEGFRKDLGGRTREDLGSFPLTEETCPEVQQIGQDLFLPDVFLHGERNARGTHEAEESLEFCSDCAVTFQRILDQIHDGTPADVIFNTTVDTCVKLEVSNENFCKSLVEIVKPQIFWILTNTKNLTARDMCSNLFSSHDCQSDNPDRVWEVSLPSGSKPPLVDHPIPKDGPTLKVLHLADTHFDPHYLPGANANCGEKYFCCHEESGPLVTPSDAAGYWGDYRNCDSPRWMLQELYTHAAATHPDVSFIIWTGDLVPHDVWNTSVEYNLEIIREAVSMVQEYFPGIPVFPAIGNHEAHPVDSYPQPYIDNEFDISWLYDEISTLWQTWLPADVAKSVMYSAYYAAEIFPNLRIISLNTNYCYTLNWWLLYDSHDPGEVLQWLSKELQEAEDAGVWVYIIGHIPSGDGDCGFTWSHQYNKIVARYEGVIAGMFYGHTHFDHFQLFFDPDDSERATKVGFVAQSQTTHVNLNPGYKVYTIDGGRDNATYTVLDHENWYFDLDAANANMIPDFQILYTAKEEYGLDDLSPQSLYGLVKEMNRDGSRLFQRFYKNYVKAGPSYMEQGCDADCKNDLLCRLLVSDTSDKSICDTLL